MSTSSDKELKAAIGWTDINKREEEVKALLERREKAARVDERNRMKQEIESAKAEYSKLRDLSPLAYLTELNKVAVQALTTEGTE